MKDFFDSKYGGVANRIDKEMLELGGEYMDYNKKFELTITAEEVVSTDETFTMNNLSAGDNYKPLGTYFLGATGEMVRRNRAKSENKISNMTLPRIALQLYEKQIDSLSVEEKKNFPVCRYTLQGETIRGIFSSVEEYKGYRNSFEYLKYKCEDDKQIVIYCWNVFSTIIFVQECLKRFGEPNDCFKLIYCKKEEKLDDDIVKDGWWPSLKEYNPNLTKEDWIRYLEEVEMPNHPSPMKMLRGMLELGGVASCKMLSETYGGSPSVYVGNTMNLGRRARQYFDLPYCIDGNEKRVFPIMFYGKAIDSEGGHEYLYRIRDELVDALNEIDLSLFSPEYGENGSTSLIEYKNPYSKILVDSKNIIFRGAPGTGKTYLAREIATDIISNGRYNDYKLLSDEQKRQIEFVQFHPSYDYSDFVEGLRPVVKNGVMGFELQDGLFKSFVDGARKNYENLQKTKEVIEKEISVQEAIDEFFSSIEFGKDMFSTVNGTEFTITDVTDKYIYISIPENASANNLTLNLDDIKKMLESEMSFTRIKDITNFFGKTFATQGFSYYFVIYNEINSKRKAGSIKSVQQEQLKKYVFIIDEINRGEISKILGELFFAIDPSYRGKAGEVSTQYSNMHSSPDEKFYIPDNVYIIGTMNDIDRSVDSFDFAMRRRFRFIELKADERIEMLNQLYDEEKKEEAIKRMNALNKAIAETEGLNVNYQIGASYFLKLKTIGFDELWEDFLKPLLQEYINGMYDEDGIMKNFEKVYGYKTQGGEMSNESN